MSAKLEIGRRSFLAGTAAVGAGFMLGFHLPEGAPEGEAAASDGVEVNAWIVIRPDDRVIIRVARSELGQGSFTGLPMLVAEELECDWNKVTAEYAPPAENLRRNRVWGNMSTGGSQSIRQSQEYLRKAGATAREMLIAAAAQRWGVPATECVAANSVITHEPTGRKVRFGSVAAAAAKLTPPAEVTLKDPKAWKLIGTSVKRLDIPDKVVGKTVFGADVRLPDMLYAAILQCPVFKGTLKSFDEAAARRHKGVRAVVPLGDAVAVVGDSYWQAQQALNAMPVTWDEGANGGVTSASILDFLRGGLAAQDAAVARREGDVKAALAGAAKVIEVEYFAPFLSHATMEPMNATARVTGDKVEIWASTQNGESTLAAAAAAAEVHPSKVEMHKTHAGGGFGRRGGTQDFARQAVRIARALPGRAVQLIWSREEDVRHDHYRPVSMARMIAGLDAAGNLTACQIRIAGQSILTVYAPQTIRNGVDLHFLESLHDLPYRVPNILVDYAMRNTHVPVGWWRAVNNTQNAYFKECFIDEVAHAAGRDPYQFRRGLLAGRPRDLGVLDAAAQMAGWGRPLAPGMFQGIAVHASYGSHCAEVAEVSVNDKGEVTVHRVVCAIDSGYMVNPDSVVTQVEGSVVYGLTAALWGEITIKNGRVEQGNFNDYPMLLMHQMPKVEAYTVPSGGFWGGVGEPAVPPLAPAVCNAIFAATGKRVRSLPLKHHDLRKV